MRTLVNRLVRKLFQNDRAAMAGLPDENQVLIREIREKKLTYLSASKLASIVNVCLDIEERNLEGAFVEAGCALGGSTILISKTKTLKRLFKVYDVFTMIPPPTENDGEDVKKRYKKIKEGNSRGIGGDKYYGYEDDLLKRVLENLASFGVTEEQHNVRIIKGLLQDTMQIDQPIAFAHIDVDWYDPVMACLERITPQLVLGGSIILDDYNDWSGCRKATDQYFRDKLIDFRMNDSAGSMKITRVSTKLFA